MTTETCRGRAIFANAEAVRNETRLRPHESLQDVLLEEMRAPNRATIEAVDTLRMTVEQRFDRFERETQDRLVRQNSADIRTNSQDIRQNSDDIRKNSEDIRDLSVRVEALGSLDHRVSALERRVSREG
jgi:hypothetical protein